MKRMKLFVALAFAAAMIMANSVPAMALVCGMNPAWDLVVAGTSTKVGTVEVGNDTQNLFVAVDTASTLSITDRISIWVGSDLANMPQLQSGDPDPTHFPIQREVNSDIITVSIPFSSIVVTGTDPSQVCGTTLKVVVYAEVNGAVAWGGTTPGTTGSQSWLYGSYSVCCEPTAPPPEVCLSDSAFAKQAYPYSWVFASSTKANPQKLPSLNLTKNSWGWAINPNVAVPVDLWMGAGLNRLENGVKVGSVTTIWDGFNATVTINMIPGYYLQEAHIYAADVKPHTTAPGQYGHSYEDLDNLTEFTVTVPLQDDDGNGQVWQIIHALVSGSQCGDGGVIIP